MARTALVTGGAGFLGRHLVDRLLTDGWTVRVLDVRPSPADAAESFTGEITDARLVAEAVKGVDAVFHLAALLPQTHQPADRMHAVNVGGVRTVLDAATAAGAGAVVFVSSVEVYGVPTRTPCPEDAPLRPIGEYGHNKVEAESLARVAAARGLHVPILRPTTIVGPGMPEPFLTQMLRAAKADKPLVLIDRGRTRFQLAAVSDVVEACLRSLDVPEASGQAFNIGSNDVPTMRETAEGAMARVGSSSRLISVPKAVAVAAVKGLGLIGKAPLEPEHLAIVLSDYVFDTAKAERVLGWKPEKDNITALVESA